MFIWTQVSCKLRKGWLVRINFIQLHSNFYNLTIKNGPLEYFRQFLISFKQISVVMFLLVAESVMPHLISTSLKIFMKNRNLEMNFQFIRKKNIQIYLKFIAVLFWEKFPEFWENKFWYIVPFTGIIIFYNHKKI